MSREKTIEDAVLRATAIFLIAVIFSTVPISGIFAAPSTGSGGASSPSQEATTPPKIHDLVTLLADPKIPKLLTLLADPGVQEWLEEQGAAKRRPDRHWRPPPGITHYSSIMSRPQRPWSPTAT
jgi:hypothetical protein